MKLEIACPNGQYTDGMKIYCKSTGRLCGNQRFKSCKGWWVLTDNARKCPKWKEKNDG